MVSRIHAYYVSTMLYLLGSALMSCVALVDLEIYGATAHFRLFVVASALLGGAALGAGIETGREARRIVRDITERTRHTERILDSLVAQGQQRFERTDPS